MYVHVFRLDTAFVLTTTRERHFEKEDLVSSPFTLIRLRYVFVCVILAQPAELKPNVCMFNFLDSLRTL